MRALEISLLGFLDISVNGKPIEVASNYVRALLIFLVIEKHHPHRREALAEMLWPERPNGIARNNLKQALANLRKALGERENSEPFLLVSRHEIQFNQSSHYQIDAAKFALQIEAYEEHTHEDFGTCKVCEKRLLDAVDLYQGDFLADFYLPDNQEFNDWVILKREIFQRQAAEVFGNLALIFENQGNIARAVEFSQQLAELEPWNEANHCNLMRLLALNGMRGAALRQYQTCCADLERELDVTPSPATQTLYEEIKAWETEGFLDNQSLQIFTRESRPNPEPERAIAFNLSAPGRRTKIYLYVLMIVSLLLAIVSFYWLGVFVNSSVARAFDDQTVRQSLPGTKAQIVIPSPTTTKTRIPEPTSALLSASSAPLDLENQAQALVAFYEQTDGPNWENAEGWISDLSPCVWHGVTCRGEKIVELDLGHNQLSGTIPTEISKLGFLENLDLGNNQLRGNIPPEIGGLSNLRYLTLWGNRELSGPIPPELGNLSNLERLELAHWESGGSLLSGEIPPELGKLKKLRYLSISVSLLEGSLPVELCALTNLEDLYLDNNRLSGSIPPEIGNLVNLGALDLGGNDFEGPLPPELGNIPMITYLAFGDSLVSGEVPAELGKLVRLRHLVLDNTNLSGPLPLSLMNLNLRELTFWGTDVCEPPDEDFQAWLDTINELWSSEIVCSP